LAKQLRGAAAGVLHEHNAGHTVLLDGAAIELADLVA
jgi:hypothetical protein